ncbi:hypothetical protein DX980_00710 (plasmid) [Burkholderia gladioli]|nr:hypothetical protein LvStA_00118 [Burkholderia gladioli]WAG17895.1 hypothetical protein DX980_00710 [Burkholderia gladioli]
MEIDAQLKTEMPSLRLQRNAGLYGSQIHIQKMCEAIFFRNYGPLEASAGIGAGFVNIYCLENSCKVQLAAMAYA